MTITLIAAMDTHRGIGFQNTIPWMGKLQRDMKHFKEVTMGHPVIMGKNTFLSLGRPLPGRTNIVLTRSNELASDDVITAASIDDAMENARKSPGSEEIFFIGGAQVYKDALPYANKLMLTLVDGTFTADTYFPEINMSEWDTVIEKKHQVDEKNLFSMTFQTLQKKTT